MNNATRPCPGEGGEGVFIIAHHRKGEPMKSYKQPPAGFEPSGGLTYRKAAKDAKNFKFCLFFALFAPLRCEGI
jgi:hypothetical protein